MFKKHPKGLPVLFFTEMWERFGFYLMLGIFFLYMTGSDPKNPGQTKLLGVVIEPGTNVVYGDVAPCVDVVADLGFKDINFGGGLGSSKTGAYSKQRRPGKK